MALSRTNVRFVGRQGKLGLPVSGHDIFELCSGKRATMRFRGAEGRFDFRSPSPVQANRD